MDVWGITLAVLRRWYIFLPLLGLAGGAASVVGEGVQPEYEVQASGLLVPGQVQPMVPNPYGGLDDAVQAVALVLTSPDARQGIAERGLIPTYEVGAASRSVIMNFTVRGDTPERAMATTEAVIELAREELGTRQAGGGVAEPARYRLDLLAQPSVIGVIYDGKLQVQAVVGVLGAGLALLVAVLFDDLVGLLRRARARQRERTSSGVVEVATDETAAPPAGGSQHTPGSSEPGPHRPVPKPISVARVRA